MLYPTLLYLRKNTASWKLHRFQPLVLLVGAASRWKWVWSADGMILTGENRILADKPVQASLLPPQILQRLTWNRTGTSGFRSRRLTDWDTTRTELLLPWITRMSSAISWGYQAACGGNILATFRDNLSGLIIRGLYWHVDKKLPLISA